ncbi:hypothetical protein H5398_07150 [Tessaracoccus sp. MC1679]|uniref:hypothetical protein n=1 Tax=Tessaracoccus sp. MC1679 TaxID=2760313 RepID=UPI00160497D9|nr:hypothetical protein [Tessaracoccus sp. MC1679]MBB1515748.1 hypothetical protein [Tessaracoccus sp. MC1679]
MSETERTPGGRQSVVSLARQSLAGAGYAEFDGKRKRQEALKADAADLETLRAIERKLEGDE